MIWDTYGNTNSNGLRIEHFVSTVEERIISLFFIFESFALVSPKVLQKLFFIFRQLGVFVPPKVRYVPISQANTATPTYHRRAILSQAYRHCFFHSTDGTRELSGRIGHNFYPADCRSSLSILRAMSMTVSLT